MCQRWRRANSECGFFTAWHRIGQSAQRCSFIICSTISILLFARIVKACSTIRHSRAFRSGIHRLKGASGVVEGVVFVRFPAVSGRHFKDDAGGGQGEATDCLPGQIEKPAAPRGRSRLQRNDPQASNYLQRFSSLPRATACVRLSTPSLA